MHNATLEKMRNKCLMDRKLSGKSDLQPKTTLIAYQTVLHVLLSNALCIFSFGLLIMIYVCCSLYVKFILTLSGEGPPLCTITLCAITINLFIEVKHNSQSHNACAF